MPDWTCAVCHTKALPGNSYITPTTIVHRGQCLNTWLQNPQPDVASVNQQDTR